MVFSNDQVGVLWNRKDKYQNHHRILRNLYIMKNSRNIEFHDYSQPAISILSIYDFNHTLGQVKLIFTLAGLYENENAGCGLCILLFMIF